MYFHHFTLVYCTYLIIVKLSDDAADGVAEEDLFL